MSPERRRSSARTGRRFRRISVEPPGDHQRFQRGLMKAVVHRPAPCAGCRVHLTQSATAPARLARPARAFPNFSLGEEYEHAPPATNRKSHRISRADDFAPVCPSKACDRTGRPFLCMSASQRLLWHGARRDLRTRGVKHACHGRDKHHRVVLSSVAWLVMRTTTCVWSRTAATTRIGCPRSSFVRVRRRVQVV
ncbi:hypothetical protein L411_00308 [Escherichia coli BWH 24]|nr:hypothetical protein L411_00308 [Escherichia coli BWH 24]